MGATLLATMRDEAPFILEWVAYHRAIGFDRIVVFSNDCTDGTDRILAALAEAGAVIHVPHAPDPGQAIAEQVGRHVLERGLIPDGDWAIWLDADEFLNIHAGEGRVADLVGAIGDARGMCISWRLFGDAGQDAFPGAFLAEPFTRCARPGQAWENVKTFFRFGPDVTELFQHKPILSARFWAEGGRFLASSGAELRRGTHPMRMWIAGRKRGKIDAAEAGWDIAQINHYAVRTRRLFDYKQARGRIGVAAGAGRKRYSADYYRQLNLNEGEDRSILRWSEATAAGAAALAGAIAGRIDLGTLLARHYPAEALHPAGSGAAPPAVSAAATEDRSTALYRSLHRSHHDEIDERRYSNARLAEAILRTLRPATVVDVGCGIGLLMSCLAEGGAEVTGIEGDWLDEASMVLPPDRYLRADLEKPFALGRRFDLCTCIEVAEHLDPARADGFVADLCALSDAVVFSAAIGGQGGQGHKNEQWQEYWCEKFEANGLMTHDPFRQAFRRDARMLPWFQQNVLLFLAPGHPLAGELAAERITPATANMILPTYHQKIVHRARRAFRRRLGRGRAGA